MWLETAPRLAIQSSLEERAFELEIRHTFYVEDTMDNLVEELKNETLIEQSFITQPTVFLYNLNNKSSNFDISSPPPGEDDFYISPDLRNCAHLVDNEYLGKITSQMQIEPGGNFSLFNNGIVISRRMLTEIELATNNSLAVGDQIDLGIASNLPEIDLGETRLLFFDMLKYSNLTINAIFDRIPQSSLFYPDFYPESLGDGVFISRSLVNHTMLQKMERKVSTPYMFIRFDRDQLSSINAFTIEDEIEAQGLRIESGNVWFVARVYTDEINLIISNYERARIIILFLFIPLVLVAFVFLLTSTSYMLRQRRLEIKLLRFKGATPFRTITLFSIEFLVLSVIGLIIGTLLAIINTVMIAQSDGFLKYSTLSINMPILDTLMISWRTWILGGFLVCCVYLLATANQIRRLIQEEHDESLIKSRTLKEKGISRKNTDIGILIATLATFVIAIQSDIVNQLSLDPQLMGLYLAGATIFWLLLGYGLSRLSSDILPRLTGVSKFFFQARHKLITVSLIRKRPQVLSIITLIVLTVSISIFSTYYSESLTYNTQKNISYLVGSDFKVFTDEKDTEFTNVLNNIHGVESTVALSQTTGSIGSYSILLIGINPNEYLKSCYWDSESIVEGTDEEVIMNKLDENFSTGIVINDFLADKLRIGVDDFVAVHRLFGSIGEEYNFTIRGVMQSAPGVGKLYSESLAIESFARFGGIVLVHETLLREFMVSTSRVFLVKSSSTSSLGLDLTKESLESFSDIRRVYDRNEKLEISYDFMAISGVAGILSADFILALLIGIIGVGVFYNYVINDRLEEYAVFRAFGGTKNQVFTLVLLETLITVIFGIILGFSLGIGFVVGFILVSRSIILSVENVFVLQIVTSPVLIGVVILTSFAALLITSAIAARKTRNVNTAALLRNL